MMGEVGRVIKLSTNERSRMRRLLTNNARKAKLQVDQDPNKVDVIIEILSDRRCIATHPEAARILSYALLQRATRIETILEAFHRFIDTGPDNETKGNVATFLVSFYFITHETKKIHALLEHPSEIVQMAAEFNVTLAVLNGQNYEPFILALEKAFDNGVQMIDYILIGHYLKTDNWKQLKKMLNHPNRMIRVKTINAIRTAEKEGKNIEPIRLELEKAIMYVS